MVTFLFHEGADIVLGSHPLELQYITDKYGNTKPRLVIYSLGNFVSNQRDRYRDGGIIFNFTVQKHHSTDKDEIVNIINVHYIPTWVYIHRTTNRNQFYVLPVLKYLKNDQPIQLPDDAYQKMLTLLQRHTITSATKPKIGKEDDESPTTRGKILNRFLVLGHEKGYNLAFDIYREYC
jgi:hypothetical protein